LFGDRRTDLRSANSVAKRESQVPSSSPFKGGITGILDWLGANCRINPPSHRIRPSRGAQKVPPSVSAARGTLKDTEVLWSREIRIPQARAIPPLRAENPQRRESVAERGEFELPVQIAEQPDDNVMWGSGAHTKCRDRPRLKHTVGYTVGNIQRRPSLRA
jgi:hypothetical protein